MGVTLVEKVLLHSYQLTGVGFLWYNKWKGEIP